MTKNYDEVFVEKGDENKLWNWFCKSFIYTLLAAVGYDGWMLSITFKTFWIFTKNKLKVYGQNKIRSGRWEWTEYGT